MQGTKLPSGHQTGNTVGVMIHVFVSIVFGFVSCYEVSFCGWCLVLFSKSIVSATALQATTIAFVGCYFVSFYFNLSQPYV